jgi:hypothetical protein
MRRRYEKLGVDIDKELNNILKNKRYGFSIMVADGILILLLFVFFLSPLSFLRKVLELKTILPFKYVIVLSMVCSVLLCYLSVFRKDKYLIAYKKIEKFDKIKKRRFWFMTLGFIILSFVLLYLSYTYR